MYELKTKKNDENPRTFLENIESDKKREQAFQLMDLMVAWTGFSPVMWGDSIIGFGSYKYTYKSGHSGEWLVTGFSPRKTALTVYILPNLDACHELLDKLGKHRRGKGCIYINKLEDIDLEILKEIVVNAYEHPLVQED